MNYFFSILLELERRHPLKLPPVSLYRFAEPDSPDNIVIETGPTPFIKVNNLVTYFKLILIFRAEPIKICSSNGSIKFIYNILNT